MPTDPRCSVVFLDAGTLPCALPFEHLAPAVRERIVYQAFDTTAPADVAARVADAEVVIVNKVKLTAELLATAPRLQRIAVAAAGTDNIDLAAAAARGIGVFNVPDYGSESVAEHAIATLLALRRHLLTYAAAAKDGRWSASPHFCWHGPRIRDLQGALLGVVGRGRIGQATARLAQGLGMRVRFAQRPGRPAAPDESPLDDLLAEADALSLHLPLTPDTRGLLNAERLARLQPHAVLINTGRGAVVDAAALADALRAGRLAGAAIDVLDVEPPPSTHPLLAPDVPNLLLTPHCAWASEAAQARLASRLVALVADHLSGSVPPTP